MPQIFLAMRIKNGDQSHKKYVRFYFFFCYIWGGLEPRSLTAKRVEEGLCTLIVLFPLAEQNKSVIKGSTYIIEDGNGNRRVELTTTRAQISGR